MRAGLTKAMVTMVAGAATAVTVLGVAAGPAFAKSDSTLSGPRAAQVRHAFRLTVSVGDDGGPRPAEARLQVRDAHGHFRWLGGWQRLHRAGITDETCTFTLSEPHRGAETFRAVITVGYLTTNTVTVVVR